MINLHSHTEFCDGRASMAEIAASACDAGFKVWGTSPHSPICCESGANMKFSDMDDYLRVSAKLKSEYTDRMKILAGMEIDYISHEFGPHIEYFRNLPLDYRIGSVHFVRTRDGRPVDCDGPAERFLKYLERDFNGDIRYVAETYFDMQLEMLEAGGFDIIGHLDKIGDNGSVADPGLEDYDWYSSRVEKVIAKAVEKGVVIEVNTKKYPATGRFFPDCRWWPLLKKYNAKIIISTDAHYPDKVDAGYREAEHLLLSEGMNGNLQER